MNYTSSNFNFQIEEKLLSNVWRQNFFSLLQNYKQHIDLVVQLYNYMLHNLKQIVYSARPIDSYPFLQELLRYKLFAR